MESLDLIKQYYDRSYGDKMDMLYEYYTRVNVPINHRRPVSEVKKASHTNAHTDFSKDIIDLKVGYMGSKITPILPDDASPNLKLKLKEFEILNNLSTMNSESVRDSAVSGLAHRLVYTKDGKIRCKNILGSQVVYEYDQTPLDPIKAYYYFEEVSLTGESTPKCHVYDRTTVTYYVGTKGTKMPVGNSAPADNISMSGWRQVGEPQPHNFQEVPIIPMQNNDMWQGEYESALPLMNLYDEILSDAGGEIKATRFALLKIFGNVYTGTDSAGKPIDLGQWLAQTNTMRFPTDDDGKRDGDAEYLEKNINDTIIENTLNRLRESIYETSSSVDISQVVRSERNFAIKAALMRLENSCATTERYLRAGLAKMMRLWAYWMRKYHNIAVGDYDVSWSFVRTFPTDIQAEAQALSILASNLTLEDALTKLGWTDAKQLAENKKTEILDSLDPDNI